MPGGSPSVELAPSGTSVQYRDLKGSQDGQVYVELLKLLYYLETAQAAPSSQASQALSQPPQGIDAGKLISGALAAAPALYAAGKGLVAAISATGPIGWAAVGIALGVGAYFFVKERKRVQLVQRSGPLWWEIERQGDVAIRDACRNAIFSSVYPQFTQYWRGYSNQVVAYLAPKGRTVASVFGAGAVQKSCRDRILVPFVFLPLVRVPSNGSWSGYFGTCDSLNTSNLAVPRPGNPSQVCIFGGQAWENFVPQMYCSVMAPADMTLWRALAPVGAKVRDLMQWAIEYPAPVSERLARLQGQGFPVHLFSPGDFNTDAYQFFAKSATLASIVLWAGAANVGRTSSDDVANIWLLGCDHSYTHNGRYHPIRAAAGVYLLCLAASAASVDLVLVEDYLAGRRDSLPIALIGAASQGSSVSEQGGNVVSAPPSYSGSGPSGPPSASASRSDYSAWLAGLGALAAGLLLLRRRKR